MLAQYGLVKNCSGAAMIPGECWVRALYRLKNRLNYSRLEKGQVFYGRYLDSIRFGRSGGCYFECNRFDFNRLDEVVVGRVAE